MGKDIEILIHFTTAYCRPRDSETGRLFYGQVGLQQSHLRVWPDHEQYGGRRYPRRPRDMRCRQMV